jgi:hypothetical protein
MDFDIYYLPSKQRRIINNLSLLVILNITSDAKVYNPLASIADSVRRAASLLKIVQPSPIVEFS